MELTDEQIDEMKDAFYMCRKKNNVDTIDIRDLRTVMMSIGLNPKEEELMQIEAEVSADILPRVFFVVTRIVHQN